MRHATDRERTAERHRHQLEEYRGRPLPPRLIDAIRRRRRDGLTIRVIAYHVGVSVWTVHKYTTTHPTGYPHHSPEEIAFLTRRR